MMRAADRGWIGRWAVRLARLRRTLSPPPLSEPLSGQEASLAQQARSEERRRLAQDLHDQIGQKIAFVNLSIHALSQHVTHADGQAKLKQIKDICDDISSDINHIVADLRPGGIEEFGLVEALRTLTDTWSAVTSIRCEFDIAGAEVVAPAHIEDTLFRVAQEALTNIAKHAATCQEVAVHLAYEDTLLVLTVEDDGAGMTARRLERIRRSARIGGYGLVAMRERVTALGGALDIHSRRYSGTRIRARIPLHEAVP